MTDLVTVDVEKYRKLASDAAARLRDLPSLDPNVDRITKGRESGVSLALSYLNECMVHDVR